MIIAVGVVAAGLLVYYFVEAFHLEVKSYTYRSGDVPEAFVVFALRS